MYILENYKRNVTMMLFTIFNDDFYCVILFFIQLYTSVTRTEKQIMKYVNLIKRQSLQNVENTLVRLVILVDILH